MSDVQVSYDVPHDRLTGLADHAREALVAHPDHETGDKAVVMLTDDAGGSGIGIFGYDDIDQAIDDIFIHLSAMFEAQGKTLSVVSLSRKGRDQ